MLTNNTSYSYVSMPFYMYRRCASSLYKFKIRHFSYLRFCEKRYLSWLSKAYFILHISFMLRVSLFWVVPVIKKICLFSHSLHLEFQLILFSNYIDFALIYLFTIWHILCRICQFTSAALILFYLCVNIWFFKITIIT